MDKKRCFECKKIKMLDCFSINPRKYQLKADMGRCIVCHTCTKARALRDMKLIILNSETQKFETLYFTSKNQVLKHIRELKLNKMEKLSFGDENPALNKGAVTSSALSDMMAQITKNFVEVEENVIKEVLRQILKREPTLEDAKDLHKFQQEGEFDKYYLAYKNLKLGTVYRNTNIEGGKMGVEFVPFENEDFLEPATNLNGTKVTF